MPDDDLLRRLRESIEADPAIDAAELVAAAWEDAVAEARTVLRAVMTKALLEQAAAQLGGSAILVPPAPRGPAPSPVRAADPPPVQKTAPPTGDWVWYVYGVTRAGTQLPDVAGVANREVVTITCGRLDAIASRVPADEFSEAALAERVTDMEWLSREAQAHERVLAEAVSGRPVLPLRFGTVYRSQERVTDFLNEHAAALTAQLDRLAGRHEWSVKILADPEAVAAWAAEHEPSVATLDAQAPTLTEGHSYFARKRRQQAVEAAGERLAGGVADECHSDLAAAAVQATTARPQDPSLSGYEGEMILNGIYLVDDTSLPEFRGVVEQLEQHHAPRGFRFVLTGPWPPHHFVDLSAVTQSDANGVLA